MNPYQSPAPIDEPRKWWSGVPTWLRRFTKTVVAIALILELSTVPVWWRWAATNTMQDTLWQEVVDVIKNFL